MTIQRSTQVLDALVDSVRDIKMTHGQMREQRRSFAWGNTHMENVSITMAMVDDACERVDSKQLANGK